MCLSPELQTVLSPRTLWTSGVEFPSHVPCLVTDSLLCSKFNLDSVVCCVYLHALTNNEFITGLPIFIDIDSLSLQLIILNKGLSIFRITSHVPDVLKPAVSCYHLF